MDGIVKNHRSLRGKKDLDTYLAPSPYQDDRGEKIGRVPQEISVAALQALGGPQSPIKAIRAKCIDCSGGSMTEARKCVAVGCALWPFRMGKNPFYGKGEAGEAVAEAAE